MSPSSFFILLPFLLIALALLFFWIASKLKRNTGMPEGRIIYADSGQWGKPVKPLYDAALGLTGKPDYLVRKRHTIIPVEVKSTWAPPVPYESHKLQLVAYCVLVESYYGKRPPYGLLRYRNRTFRVNFSEELEYQLLDVLDEIRAVKEQSEACRSHNQKNRCARCGYRYVCDQRL
ncbi:MAG: CRISPR-associated exonuclease Cas4 [Chloroflexota bacterium]|nr:CRISPR-associated exonuclease Cas4 [Chloroflexota bacterium]